MRKQLQSSEALVAELMYDLQIRDSDLETMRFNVSSVFLSLVRRKFYAIFM